MAEPALAALRRRAAEVDPLAAQALELAAAALSAVDPEPLVRRALRGEAAFDAVFALGKAAAAMARGASPAARPGRRLAVRPASAPALARPDWEEHRGGHPLADEASFAAGERALAWLAGLRSGERLLALVSGGGSACLEWPAAGVERAELIARHRALLASGLPIGAVNAARRRLSATKGGGLARVTAAQILVLVLSDVPGDELSTVASGPFWDPALGARVSHRLLAGVGRTAEAAASAAARLGFAVARGELAGEAATMGRELVARGRALAGAAVALVAAGETTVAIERDFGRGGRNQELALAAARELSGGAGECLLALGTDGIDGPTPAAGALVDGRSWGRIAAAGVDAARALARHDSYGALAAADLLLETGPTGTNAADFALYLRRAL